MTWPLEGGQTKIVSVDRNLRGIVKRGGELATTVAGYLTRFPQLAKEGTVKVNYGSVEVTLGAAATTTAFVKVTHELGVTPKSVVATVDTEGTGGVGGNFAEVMGIGATTFEVRGARPFGAPGKETKFIIGWQAYGP